MTSVSPCAYRPASSSADFTWALATGSVVADAVQRLAAVHMQRRQAVALSIFAPILASGSVTRRIGPLRQRRIAHQRAVERLPRQQAGQQAHAGAGVAAVQRLRCTTQAMQADAMHDALAVGGRLDTHAELLQHGGGGARVLALEEAADMRSAIGQSRPASARDAIPTCRPGRARCHAAGGRRGCSSRVDSL